MSTPRDPPRILASEEPVPSILRDGLESERMDAGPDPNHIARLADKLAPAGALAGKTGSSFTWWRGLVLAGAGLLAIAGVAELRSKSVAPPVAVAPAPMLAAPAVASVPTTEGAAEPALPVPGTSIDPPAVRADELPVVAASVASPRPKPVSARSERAAPSSAPTQKSASDSTEIELLARAHAALQGRPGETLALCEKHRETFADGRFTQEREALAIEALLYLHRRDEAERRWNDFQQRYPASNHRVHLADLFSSAR